MTAPRPARCIFLTEEDLATPLDSAFRELVRDRFNAAPEDATEAVAQALCDDANLHAQEDGVLPTEPRAWSWEAETACRALGFPTPEPTDA